MPKKDFLFVDLQAADITKPIDGMAAGVFTDMWGYEFEIKAEDLPEYVLKTNMALQSTRDSDGNIVGFPIDTMSHNHAEAAGWMLDAKQVGGTVQVMTRWNDHGRELISSDQMRYFSPTIDLEAKVIMGGSLTNWPATRTRDHQLLLRPVELSSQLQALDEISWMDRVDLIAKKVINGLATRLPDNKPNQPQEEEMEWEKLTQEQKDELLGKARAELASGTLPVELQAQLEKRAGEIADEKMAVEKRSSHIAELTQRLTGGNDATPHGLPIPADELAELLTSLTPETQERVESVLGRIAEQGLIDFNEHGSSQVQSGTTPLPPEMARQLNIWLSKDGNTVEEFFKVNAVELGAMADYNLAEFHKE